jgi:molecular chaperone IbpA
VIAQQNQLIIPGKRAEDKDGREYMHRGIATFERRFELADFIQVGKATFEHGLLSIELKRVIRP